MIITLILRREFLSLSCCWLSLTLHKNWCQRLIGGITSVDESLNGCVVAINGCRHYFMLLKLPAIREIKSSNGDDSNCEEFLGMEDLDNVEATAKQLKHRLPDWIGRLREGSLTRYFVESWPKISIADDL